MTVFADLLAQHPPARMAVLFDVGANVGQTSAMFRRAWPDAAIHAFEPVAATAALLREALAGDGKALVVQAALGAAAGEALITAIPGGLTNAILAPEARSKHPVERVPVITGDGYCAAERIDRVDFLKVDAEGHDLAVLQGFAGMLGEARVGYVQVEVGFTPENRVHVPFAEVSTLLEPFGFRVYGFYNQRQEKRTPALRRADVVFAHRDTPTLPRPQAA